MKELNSYISDSCESLKQKQIPFMVTCPACGKTHICYHTIFTNSTEQAKCVYLEGTVKKIIDKDEFYYDLENNGMIIPVYVKEPALHRLFLRPEYHILLSGIPLQKDSSSHFFCTCGQSLAYENPFYYIQETHSKICVIN